MIDIKLKSIIDSMRKESEQQACQTQHNLLDNKYHMLLDTAPLPIVAFKASLACALARYLGKRHLSPVNFGTILTLTGDTERMARQEICSLEAFK